MVNNSFREGLRDDTPIKNEELRRQNKLIIESMRKLVKLNEEYHKVIYYIPGRDQLKDISDVQRKTGDIIEFCWQEIIKNPIKAFENNEKNEEFCELSKEHDSFVKMLNRMREAFYRINDSNWTDKGGHEIMDYIGKEAQYVVNEQKKVENKKETEIGEMQATDSGSIGNNGNKGKRSAFSGRKTRGR